MDGLLDAKRKYAIETEVLVDDASKLLSHELSERMRDFDLLLVAGGTAQQRLVDEVAQNPDTRFVYLDTQDSVDLDPVAHRPNFSDVFFAAGPVIKWCI